MPQSFEELVDEADRAPIEGWDFGWLEGRALEERPSWHYFDVVAERVRSVASMLDIQTGDGRMIGSSSRPTSPRRNSPTNRACHDRAVARPIRYRNDLYRGTAEYYDRFRVPYPAALFDHLRARVPLHGDARVLDLACGPGPIAFGLAPHVRKVLAVDQEPEFIDFGRRKAESLGVTNINWLVATAEEVLLEGAFDLVAIGNAFHRLDRDGVSRRLVAHVRPGGCVALLWSRTPNRGDRPWQRALEKALERWMDVVQSRDRIPVGWQEAMDRDKSKDVLHRAGFTYEGEFEFSMLQRWSIESLTGFVYSTSFLNRDALGDQVTRFEDDLRTRLLTCCPDGVFEQDVTFAYELARR